MIEGDCTGAAENTAVELFQLAVAFLGSESAALAAVEESIARVQTDPCADPDGARREVMTEVIRSSLGRVESEHPRSLVPPEENRSEPSSCLDIHGLDASGMDPVDVGVIVDRVGHAQMRSWLESLAPAPRAVFVLRGLARRSGEDAAADLSAGGKTAWTTTQVSVVFREALCRLAGSLARASGAVAA